MNDLRCLQCSLKFNNQVWYDLHLTHVHGNENKSSDIATELEPEPSNVAKIEQIFICEPKLKCQLLK